jgi:hypothetical protein
MINNEIKSTKGVEIAQMAHEQTKNLFTVEKKANVEKRK